MRPCERGQSLVEFAFILILMLVLGLGVFELARGWYYANAINNGVRAGLRYASGLQSLQPDDERVRNYIFGEMTSLPVEPADITVSTDLKEVPFSGENITLVTISVSYNLDLITGNVLQNLFNLSGSGSMPNTFTLERHGTMYYELATL